MIFEDATTSLTNDFLTDMGTTSFNETLKSSDSTISEPIQIVSVQRVQRSIQRKRQQQKSFDAFLMTIEHEEHLSSSDIEILYHSINDNSSLHLTDISI
ncbi:unnamed protein product [Rotaria socialis]|uniref:Uncharacterized protein n=1 Tax=Rotaria socialis TaxID=392032 RepID=A0A820VUC5_9BILA|nr:unnamed protein product [Rotaria socialis]CAF4624904.1 unnamed protein product [Rotaria socialis]